VIVSGRDRSDVEAAGRRAFPGFELRTLARTRSTQDVVRAAARGGAAAGFCCVADQQSAGRGRQGRTWTAPAGSALLCSILVRVGAGEVTGVPLAAGLAVRAALLSSAAVEARLKWPNDVMVAGRKLAGILCEVEPGAPATAAGTAVVVGAGINLTAEAAPAAVAAVSVEEVSGAVPTAGAVLTALVPELARSMALLSAGGVAAIRAAWMRHSWGMGATVVARGPDGDVTGTAEALDDDGALLVRTGATLTRVVAADVHLVGPPGVPRG
jgi:BirA family biotin operon repressor/biotin-[acetyl-CoA-carboxylase] ligase